MHVSQHSTVLCFSSFKCITAFGHRVVLFSPIWLKESDPAGMMRGLVESEDTVFLIRTIEMLKKGFSTFNNKLK